MVYELSVNISTQDGSTCTLARKNSTQLVNIHNSTEYYGD